ncbi:hypothetical protein KBD45_00190 [Candidatus Dojkabacteria bacterium]|nr:hypothetical protein [Candidatus Dojkabacteria bacterium]
MNKLSVKNKVVVISAFSMLYYLFAHQLNVIEIITKNNLIFITPVILSLIMLVGCVWLLNIRSGLEKFFLITLYSCLNVFAFSLFFEILLINQTRIGQISITLVFSLITAIIFYVHSLTANIINYSHIRDIPLVYAARATAYIISLLSEYFIFFIILNSDLNVVLKVTFSVSVAFFHSYFLLDSIKQKFQNKLNSALAISLLIVIFDIMLLMWPISSEIKSIILTLIMYICIGISLEIKERINKSIWIEYIILIISIILLLLFLSSWGINGHLL